MTILRVGPNKNYSDGWEKAFSAKKGAAKPTAKKPVPSKKASPKKSAKKGKK